MKDGKLTGHDSIKGEREISVIEAKDLNQVKSLSFKGILIATGSRMIEDGILQKDDMDYVYHAAIEINSLVEAELIDESMARNMFVHLMLDKAKTA